MISIVWFYIIPFSTIITVFLVSQCKYPGSLTHFPLIQHYLFHVNMKVNDTTEAKIGCITSSKIPEMYIHPKDKLLVFSSRLLKHFFPLLFNSKIKKFAFIHFRH